VRLRLLLPLSVALVSLGLLAAGCPKQATTTTASTAEPRFDYPDARRGDVVDDYFGTQVADPYRWLEAPDADETQAWVEAQNALTQGYIGQIPERERIHRRLTKLWDFERYGQPEKAGDKWLWTYNSGLMDQSVLYVADSLDDKGEILLDPNTFSEDGTVALADLVPSPDGSLLAFAVSDGGSDWHTWKVLDMESRTELKDRVEWSKFGPVSWHPDGTGFWYGRFPEPENPLEAVNENYQLWYHVVGTPQGQDTLVYEDPKHPERQFAAALTADDAWLMVYTYEGTAEKNRLWVRRVDEPEAEFTRVFDKYDAAYSYLANDGDRFWVYTNRGAPNGKVISFDVSAPEEWTVVVPHLKEVIEAYSCVGGQLILSYLKDARSLVRTYGLDGAATGEVALPGIGTAWGFSGEQPDTETFFSYASFTTPATTYRYVPATGEVTLWRQPTVDWDADAFVTTQEFYESKDGTKVPMFLTRRKDVEPSGDVPTLLYGYGGFNISITPYYSLNLALWAEMGGLVAVPNLRGGGEYGQDWHNAGTKQSKQNVFDDFIGAAEHLFEQGWTKPERLATYGGSNGGLLVGAVMTQRPDLCKVAIPVVGVLDMLRYHMFTIGWAWADDYGRSDDDESMFAYLLGYSPLHTLEEGTTYPSTLVFTGDHDDRVVPAHSFKFTAELQRVDAGVNPQMIRIETRAGHSAGKSTTMRIDESADRWAFAVRELGWVLPQGWGEAPVK
jgi:prolyl oligopeptidase